MQVHWKLFIMYFCFLVNYKVLDELNLLRLSDDNHAALFFVLNFMLCLFYIGLGQECLSFVCTFIYLVE